MRFLEDLLEQRQVSKQNITVGYQPELELNIGNGIIGETKVF
jgi:hypothetical protein